MIWGGHMAPWPLLGVILFLDSSLIQTCFCKYTVQAQTNLCQNWNTLLESFNFKVDFDGGHSYEFINS